MALYNFKCEQCGKTADVVCTFAELEKKIPRHCKRKMARVFVAPSVFFYGSGFSKNEK